MDVLAYARDRLPVSPASHRRIYSLTGSSAALLLAIQESPFVAVEADADTARQLWSDITFFRSLFGGRTPIYLPESDGASSAGARSRLITELAEADSVVTSAAGLSAGVWDRSSLEEHLLLIGKGLVISRDEFEDRLVGSGYVKVPMVAEPGEFSRREWIFDLYPSTAESPLRIEFFGDEIDQVRSFDIETQRSLEMVPESIIYPACESGEAVPSGEFLADRAFYCLHPSREAGEYPEHTVFLSRYSFEYTGAEHVPPEGEISAGVSTIRGRGILPEERRGVDELPERIAAAGEHGRVMIVASSDGQAERLRDIFREHDMVVPVLGTGESALYEGKISITVGALSCGMVLDELVIVTEREIFGSRPHHRPLKKSRLSNLLMSIDDITPGDFVVHQDHGVGRFAGVVRQDREGSELELMLIEYEAGRVYIPIQNIQNVSKYRAEEGVTPRLDKLGGKTWQRKKERARKNVRAIAERLIALYAGRKTVRGFSFTRDTEMHREFDSFFAYEPTPDQAKAIADIKADMESGKPMDRLLCGDVGYGKTEVAMRAAFKAVYDNKQVAVLVPTTILAEQHYHTFTERFSGFPVTIDFMSRFKTRKEIEATLQRVARGDVDIIIGTHGILSKRLSFDRLGLLIVDEEHKFGVGQKERIKEVSRDVDALNLTATPIPRTLHMALSGIRDISVIETPPEERLSVKSVVTVFADGVIRDAVERELRRDGQVFFVHNRIHDIYKIAGHIQSLAPSARVGVAHGEMPERELQHVMHLFFKGAINVLVSTAIVGAGLDIPRANTIIIDRADRMGLADLYQLRGRVGRSNVKGYAFFLAPPEDLLTDEAKKRLQAVQEMSYLGAGFRLALKDLEIRGAGDIFGAEQSGHIHEIGFDLYIEMLEEAVSELKGEPVGEAPEPEIKLKSAALIPDDYVEDVTIRLSLYRRVAALKTDEEATGLEEELRDRFGPLPGEVRGLIEIMRLKTAARQIAVVKIAEDGERVKVVFSPETPVAPEQIIGLRDNHPGIRFQPDGFELKIGKDREDVVVSVKKALQELIGKSVAGIGRDTA